MDKKEIIKKIEEYVREKLTGEGSGHDWWHIFCVRNTALNIAGKEGGDTFIVEIAALLHDVSDWKEGNTEEETSKLITEILENLEVEKEDINKVVQIITTISFKGINEVKKVEGIEAEIVQDADRLDSIGALGVARVFAYGGNKGQEIYNPDIKPEPEKFKERRSLTSINHFYEKLLLLKDLMNTKTGKEMAEARHKYLEDFLEEFYAEWEGKK